MRSAIIIYTFAIVLLASNFNIDAAKTSSRRSGGKTKSHAPNADHVRLSYGSHATANRPQAHVPSYPSHQQTHVQQSHAAPPYPVRPSAPELPRNNAPINTPASHPVGWNVGHSDAAHKQTVSNTNTAYQQPHGNPPPYSAYPQNTGQHGAPPPYSANPVPNPHVPAAAPPPYSSNGHINQQQQYPAGQPPAYAPNAGVNGFAGK